MRLSKNEMTILWGLVRYPMMNDRQLSDTIGIRMSTLNAIKNKMKRSKIIFDRIVPNVEIMDYEVITACWAPLTRIIREKKDRDLLVDLFGKFQNTYSAMVFGDTLFFLSLFKNYTQFRRIEHRIRSVLKDEGLLAIEDFHSTIYPLSISRLNKNFDYTTVLERAFSIEPVTRTGDTVTPENMEHARTKIHHLTNKEKTILRGILKSPDMPDNKVASQLDTTRQAVARHKKELLDLGVIRKTRVIDYGKLGFKILCLVQAHYDRLGEDLSYPDTTPLHLPSFFSIYGLNETVSLSLFQDFDQFTVSREHYSSLMKDFCIVRGEPMISLFSPAATFTIKHQEYLPLVEEFISSKL